MLTEMIEHRANWTITPITGVFGAELCGAQARDGVDPAWLSSLLEDHGTTERRVRRVTIRGGLPVGPTGVESRVADDPLLTMR